MNVNIDEENQELKEKLVKGALNPDCMRDCSHVLIFAGWDRYTEERIDKVYNLLEIGSNICEVWKGEPILKDDLWEDGNFCFGC